MCELLAVPLRGIPYVQKQENEDKYIARDFQTKLAWEMQNCIVEEAG
jgi:hypothetical protein